MHEELLTHKCSDSLKYVKKSISLKKPFILTCEKENLQKNTLVFIGCLYLELVKIEKRRLRMLEKLRCRIDQALREIRYEEMCLHGNMFTETVRDWPDGIS